MTKRSTKETKRDTKKAQLLERVGRVFSWDPAITEHRLSQGLAQSVRINPLQGDPSTTLSEMVNLGWKGTASPWCESGYSIQEGFEQLRDSALIDKGKIYIQNQASWLPVVSLQPQPGERILDVCAAPGGKTSHIAAILRNNGHLIANDNSRPRLMKLQANLIRLGAKAELSLYDATRLKHTLHTTFDKILLDAPCSGEGLIDLRSPASLDAWSVAHIRRLSDLQRRLIHQAWQLLETGGLLVYSTCTTAPEENEAVIDWLLRREPSAAIEASSTAIDGAYTGILTWGEQDYDTSLQLATRLAPGNGREAFFTCIIKKYPSPQRKEKRRYYA